MSSPNCCFLPCIQISQEAGQVVWHSHLFQNFPQFIVIHTVKGFGIVNAAEIDVFLELSSFFHDPADVGNLISGSSAFSKTSLNIWKFTVHILLKPGLENFEYYFTMWDECNCAVVCKQLIDGSSFCCSVAKPCLTLCEPMDYSISGFPVLHYLLEFAQTHVHWARDVIQPSWGVYGGSDNKEFVCNAEELCLSPGSGRSLEKGMEIHSSILAWKIPWTEEPGRLHTVHRVAKSRTGLKD